MALKMFRIAYVTVFVLVVINLLASVATGNWFIFIDALILAMLGYYTRRRSLIALGLVLGDYSLGFLAMPPDSTGLVFVIRLVVVAILVGGIVALSVLNQQPTSVGKPPSSDTPEGVAGWANDKPHEV